MGSPLSFEAFWTFATTKARQKNALHYHKCCDIWTTRKCKFARASHNLSISWAEFLFTLDRSGSDQKQVAQAKMIEEGMQISVVINKPCQHNSTATIKPTRGRKPRQPSMQPQYNFGRSGAFNFTQPPEPICAPQSIVLNYQSSTSPEKKENIGIKETLQNKTNEFYKHLKSLTSKLDTETKTRKALQTQVDELLVDKMCDNEQIYHLKSDLKFKENRLIMLEKKVEFVLRKTEELEKLILSEKHSVTSEDLHRAWGTYQYIENN